MSTASSACHSAAAQALEVLFAARLAPGNAGGALRAEAGRFRFAQHPPHVVAQLAGKLALGQFGRAQFVIRAAVVAAKRSFAAATAATRATHVHLTAVVAVAAVAAVVAVAVMAVAVMAVPAESALATRLVAVGVAAVRAMFHRAARLRVKRPVAVMAAPALATHLNAAVTAVPPAPHLAARLRAKRSPAVRPSAAPFMNDNRYFGQNLHLKCMVAWDSTRPGDAA